MYSDPCAKLTTRVTPKISVSPALTRNSVEPYDSPAISWPRKKSMMNGGWPAVPCLTIANDHRRSPPQHALSAAFIDVIFELRVDAASPLQRAPASTSRHRRSANRPSRPSLREHRACPHRLPLSTDDRRLGIERGRTASTIASLAVRRSAFPYQPSSLCGSLRRWR